jgi:hypothetical protein
LERFKGLQGPLIMQLPGYGYWQAFLLGWLGNDTRLTIEQVQCAVIIGALQA